jgi:hypothetical protein
MTDTDSVLSDPGAFAEAYERHRDRLVQRSKRRHAPATSPAERERWQEEKGPCEDTVLFELVDDDPEEIIEAIDERSRTIDAAYDQFEAERRPSVSGGAIGDREPPHERLDPQADTHTRDAATPVAVLSVASDRQLLEETVPDWDIHNPWAERKNGDFFQDLHIDAAGNGSGYTTPGLKEHDRVTWQDVHWVFAYTPSEPWKDGSWLCTVDPELWGEITCWVDDSWSTSKYASILLDVRVSLSPIQSPYMQPWMSSVSEEQRVIHHHGQNVFVHEYGSWFPSFSVSPKGPGVDLNPHWITVSVSARTRWRGSSRVRLNFSSKHDGTHPDYDPRYLYLMNPKIHRTGGIL